LTLFGSRSELLDGGAGCVAILVMPDAVIFAHSFAPVSHGEIGVEFFCATEVLSGVFVLEIVELREAVKEIGLGSGGAGVGEGDFADSGGFWVARLGYCEGGRE